MATSLCSRSLLFVCFVGCLIGSFETVQVSADSKISLDSLKTSNSPVLPHQTKSGKNIPKILKIFENPNPNDGYESLREFSDGITKGMFKKQLYNTSIALTSALLSFQLPRNSDSEEVTISHANQTIFGLFALLTGVLIFALPVLLTGQKFNPEARGNNGDGFLSKIMQMEPVARLLRNGAHTKIGLEPEKCSQKTICEAHRAPENKRYGMLAVPIQMFYPPLAEDADQSSASPFQKAAFIGKYTTAKCSKKYNCFFDVLDLGRYLLDWYQYNNGAMSNTPT